MSVRAKSAIVPEPQARRAAERPTLHEIRADRALEANFARHWPAVCRQVGELLRENGGHVPDAELQASYSLAWSSMHALIADGTRIENEIGWLIRTTYRRAIDWLRGQHQSEQEEFGSHAGDADVRAIALEDHVDRQRKVRSLIEALRHRFRPRETLVLFYGLVLEMPRPEIARELDIPLKRLHKLLDGHKGGHGLKTEIREHIEVIAAGEWCETYGSLIRAHALGWFDPSSPKYGQAAEHLQTCSACRRYYRAQRGLAMVLPPMMVPAFAQSDRWGLLDPLHAALRTATRPLRDLLGMGVPSDGVVAAGATAAGGGAVAGGLLSGTQIAVVCSSVIAVAGTAACLWTGDVPLVGPSPPAAVSAPPTAAPAATSAEPGRLVLGGTAAGGLGLGGLVDPLALAGSGTDDRDARRYDFGIENDTPRSKQRRRPQAAGAPRTGSGTTSSIPAEPPPSSPPPGDVPAAASPAPEPAPAVGGEFGFER